MCPPPRTGCVNSCKLRTDAADKALPQTRIKGQFPSRCLSGMAAHKIQITGIRYQPSPRDFFRLPTEVPLQAGFCRSFSKALSHPLRFRRRAESERSAAGGLKSAPCFPLSFSQCRQERSQIFQDSFDKNDRIPKKAVDISGLLCYHATITNAMTQSSKQGDPPQRSAGWCKARRIKLPNWLYSGCVELEVDADGSSRYSSRDMMVSR